MFHKLAGKYDALSYIDEAHATGVFGKKGEGLCTKEIAKSKRVIIIGTFGKALGNFGAFFAGPALMRDYFINRARSYIYTTALPPPGGMVIAA